MGRKLPKNWKLLSIKDFAKTKSGGTPSTSVIEYWDGNIPWINSGMLKDAIITEYSKLITEKGLKESSASLFPVNTVVIALTGVTTGKVGLLGIETSTNQSITGIFPNNTYVSKFLFYQLKSLRNVILEYALGTAQPHINKAIVDNLEIILPPLAEQECIVTKLDALFAQHEAMKKALERIPQLLKDFRQQVLTQAVRGQLTKEWRKSKDLEEWNYKRALNCCLKVQSGGTPKGSKFSAYGIPFLKVYNIVNNKINFDYKPQYVSEEIHNSQLKKSIAYPGDVIMNIVGPPLNKIAILNDQYPEWNLNQAITIFRVGEELSNRYLYYFFCEGSSVKSLVNETKGVVGQVNISLSQCRNFDIPVPSIKEQQEIVYRVESLFAKADKIEERCKVLKSKIEALPQSILHKAFKGELVNQLPTDGDARDLLKEINELRKLKK